MKISLQWLVANQSCNEAIRTIQQGLASHHNHKKRYHCRQPIYCVQQNSAYFHSRYFHIYQLRRWYHSSEHLFAKAGKKNLEEKYNQGKFLYFYLNYKPTHRASILLQNLER